MLQVPAGAGRSINHSAATTSMSFEMGHNTHDDHDQVGSAGSDSPRTNDASVSVPRDPMSDEFGVTCAAALKEFVGSSARLHQSIVAELFSSPLYASP